MTFRLCWKCRKELNPLNVVRIEDKFYVCRSCDTKKLRRFLHEAKERTGD